VSFMPYVPYSSEDPRRPLVLRQVADVIDRCQDAVDHAVSIRVPCAPRHCLESTPVAIEEPVRREFDDHCAAGILWASVSYDGRLRHCPHSSVYAGSVTGGIGNLWRSVLQPTVRAALTPQGACAGCSQFSACGGGCHLNKITSYPDATVGSRRSLPLVPIGGPHK
jgi:radical SAM protein with 4Fe4S-binding SPASM domain